MREISEPHEVQNAQAAPETVQHPVGSSTVANCPSGGSNSTTPAVSPLFEGTFVPGINFDLEPSSALSEQSTLHPERKRRRIIGNMDNTLDGLVAKRVDVEPNTKRYQTETEAIELPDDELEAKRLETDPDVSTRMCSICGYQGKWVSEMIRHKRVHVTDRPFKCKYCNRTSKWKADLIRHIAKTHGIRVVSKYSRSKAFDTQSGKCEEMAFEEIKTPKKRDMNNNKSSNHYHPGSVIHKPMPNHSTFKSGQSTACLLYKCQSCLFEQDSMDVLVHHLRLVHELAPFECRQCDLEFGNVQQVSAHCAESGAGCTPLHVKINFQINNQASSTESRPEGLLTVATKNNANSLSIPANIDSDTASSAPSSCGSSADFDSQHALSIHSCTDCPYRTQSLQKLDTHRLGHQVQRGLFNYKCVFCNWFAKKKISIEKHMAVHTSKPAQFMQQVERNLITPLATNAATLGGALAPVQQQNFIAPMAPVPNVAATAFGLLSALYSANGPNLLAMGGSPVNTAPAMPEMGAFKELTTNPLLAFSLCSLLRDNLANQAQQTPMPFLGSTPPGLLQAASTRLSAFDFSNLN